MDNQVHQTEYKHSLPAGVEHRFSGDVQEVRATDDGVNRLRGYALKWDQSYKMHGFSESIGREALKDAEITRASPILTVPSVADPPSVPLRVTVGGVLSIV